MLFGKKRKHFMRGKSIKKSTRDFLENMEVMPKEEERRICFAFG